MSWSLFQFLKKQLRLSTQNCSKIYTKLCTKFETHLHSYHFLHIKPSNEQKFHYNLHQFFLLVSFCFVITYSSLHFLHFHLNLNFFAIFSETLKLNCSKLKCFSMREICLCPWVLWSRLNHYSNCMYFITNKLNSVVLYCAERGVSLCVRFTHV